MTSTSRTAIQRFLRSAGTAVRWRRAAATLGMVAAGLGLLLAGGLGIVALAPSWRTGVAAGMALAGAAAVVRFALVALAPLRPAATAHWVARLEPGEGGAVADASELAEAAASHALPAGASRELVVAHVDAVASRLENLDPRALAAREVPSRRGGLAAVGLAVAAAACLGLPSAVGVLLHGPPPPPPDHALAMLLELTLRPPEYLGLPPRVQSGGDLVAPVGTHVTVRVVADRPLVRVGLVMESAPPVALVPHGEEATGVFVVTGDDHYRVRLEGDGGGVDPAPPVHAVKGVVDQPPRVRLRGPQGDVLLEPGESLALAYGATDDHGVVEIAVVVEPAEPEDPEPEAAGAGPGSDLTSAQRTTVAQLDPAVTSHHGLENLAPARLGLAPGKAAWVRVEARDGDTVSGPKWGSSRRVKVVVRSSDDAAEVVEEAESQLVEQLIATLADHLVRDPALSRASEDVVLAHRGFVGHLEQVVGAFPRAIAAVASGANEDQAAASALELMRRRLQDLLRARLVGGAQLSSPGAEARLLTLARAVHPGEVEELERDVLFFDTWADRRAAFRALDAREQILAAARAIESALARTESGAEASAAGMAAAGEAAAALGDALARLAPSLQSLAAGGGEEAKATLEAERSLAEARAALDRTLAASDPEGARRAAEAIAELAGELGRRLSGLADQGALGDPELAREVQEVRQALAAVRRKQGDLRDRTNRLREEVDAQVPQEAREMADRLYQELLELTDEALADERRGEEGVERSPRAEAFFRRLDEESAIDRKLLDIERRVERAGGPKGDERQEHDLLLERQRDLLLESLLDPVDVESLMRGAQGARDQLRSLRQTLADRDAGAARRPARGSLSFLDLMAAEIGRAGDAAFAQLAAPFRAGAATASEIVRKLEELERQTEGASRAALTAEQAQQMASLGTSQDGLRQEAQDLLSRLRQLGSDAPFLGEEVGGHVDEAARHMAEAEDSLGRRGLQPASEQQGEAMEALADAAKSLSPSQRSQGRPGGDSQRDGRRGLDRDEVAIPDASAFKVPREFREEILEAMRESAAPAGYEESVREYYRRLVE